MTTTITVAAVYPKPRGPHAVKDGSGTIYKFWPTSKKGPPISFSLGSTYSLETEARSSTGADGTVYNDTFVTQATLTSTANAPQTRQNGSGAPQYAPDLLPYMPFVSNVVAHAITAGRIEQPEQIQAWADRAQRAYHSLKLLESQWEDFQNEQNE